MGRLSVANRCAGCHEAFDACVCAQEHTVDIRELKIIVRVDGTDEEGEISALDQANIDLARVIQSTPHYLTKETRKVAHKALDRLLDDINKYHYNKNNRGPADK